MEHTYLFDNMIKFLRFWYIYNYSSNYYPNK
jgi:hypothetical protein